MRTVALVVAVLVLGSWEGAAQEAAAPAEAAVTALRETVDSQAKAIDAMRAELAEMRKAVIEAARASQAPAPNPDQLQQAYRAAVRAQAARCGRKGFRFVAVGTVDGKEAAFCLADMPQDLKP